MESKVRSILEGASDQTIADHIVNSFKEVERNYFLKSWKTSELDAGHFVESVRRFLEQQLFGGYTPFEKPLKPLNDKTILSYLQASGDEAYRVHIPRALLTVYGIRNKRGVGHVSAVSPNYLDATLILSSVKWVLAELIRINSALNPDETGYLVEQVVERSVEGVWEENNITRILVDGLTLKEQIMFLLYATKEVTDKRLLDIIEYNNQAYFKKTLRQLHKDRFIEYKESGECIISPKGVMLAEEIVLSKVKG